MARRAGRSARRGHRGVGRARHRRARLGAGRRHPGPVPDAGSGVTGFDDRADRHPQPAAAPPPPPEVQPPRQEDEEADDDEGFEPVSGASPAGGLRPWPWWPSASAAFPCCCHRVRRLVSRGRRSAATAAAPLVDEPSRSPAPGPRPSTAAPRPACGGRPVVPRRRPCRCTSTTARRRSCARWRVTCAGWRPRSTGPPTPPRRRRPGTPLRRGTGATTSARSCDVTAPPAAGPHAPRPAAAAA